jgi:hypothetical protein
MSEAEQSVYGQGLVIPLWDDGNFDAIVGLHTPSNLFLRFWVEDGVDLTSIRLLSWQQVLLHDFVRIYESEMPDDQFRATAADFGFRFAEEIISAYAQHQTATSALYDAWFEALVARIGA